MRTKPRVGEHRTKRREAAAELDRGAVARRIERRFTELSLSWRRDGDGWSIDAAAGRVSAELDEDDEVLTFSRVIGQLWESDSRNGNLYGALLRDNYSANGAHFALMDAEADGEPPYLVVVGSIAPASLDTARGASVLRDVSAAVSSPQGHALQAQ